MSKTSDMKSKPFDMAYHGHISPLKALIHQNDKLKTQIDENGRMLLHWASLGGHEELVSYLLSLDVPVDEGDDMQMTPLILAASAGREKIVDILIKEGANINAKSSEGHSALQYAASKNWKSICVKLIEENADINIADKRGATPLHRAASKGNTEIVKLLLNCGNRLKIDQKDVYGNTALHLVLDEDREEEAKLLVLHGANLKIQNKEEKTPIDLCKRRSLAQELIDIAKTRSE